MIRETAGESALDAAARRLERAVASLEQRIGERSAAAPSSTPPSSAASAGDLFGQDDDRERLTSELEASRARERELEAAGAEASEALARAIAEIKAALNGPAAEAAE